MEQQQQQQRHLIVNQKVQAAASRTFHLFPRSSSSSSSSSIKMSQPDAKPLPTLCAALVTPVKFSKHPLVNFSLSLRPTVVTV
jgi:hypothetical protein